MKVLLAIDGSPCSLAAIHEVARHPWPTGTMVRLVIVDGPLGESTLGTGRRAGAGDSAYDELVRCQRDDARNDLNEAVALLQRTAPALAISASLLEGSPKEQIVDEARRWGADMIVVGSHGHGAVTSFFLGSVSLAVVLAAPCSVLVVRSAPSVSPGPASA